MLSAMSSPWKSAFVGIWPAGIQTHTISAPKPKRMVNVSQIGHALRHTVLDV